MIVIPRRPNPGAPRSSPKPKNLRALCALCGETGPRHKLTLGMLVTIMCLTMRPGSPAEAVSLHQELPFGPRFIRWIIFEGAANG